MGAGACFPGRTLLAPLTCSVSLYFVPGSAQVKDSPGQHPQMNSDTPGLWVIKHCGIF